MSNLGPSQGRNRSKILLPIVTRSVSKGTGCHLLHPSLTLRVTMAVCRRKTPRATSKLAIRVTTGAEKCGLDSWAEPCGAKERRRKARLSLGTKPRANNTFSQGRSTKRGNGPLLRQLVLERQTRLLTIVKRYVESRLPWVRGYRSERLTLSPVINRAFMSATGRAGLKIAAKMRAHAQATSDVYGEYSAAQPSTLQKGPERASLIMHSPLGYPNPEGGVEK